jgi:hypothetical protein
MAAEEDGASRIEREGQGLVGDGAREALRR